MVWYTTEDARRDALRQSANMERSRCAEELLVMAKNLAECKKTPENDSAVSALVEAANRLKATGCSSLCANGEPCSVAADGRCEAMPNDLIHRPELAKVRWNDGLGGSAT